MGSHLKRLAPNGALVRYRRAQSMNKPRGRPFQEGNQFGRGRPKGSRNQPKTGGQPILNEYAEHLIRKLIAMALQGDARAMRLCMERISPARRDTYMRMNLPAIATARDVHTAAEKVTRSMRRGTITMEEAVKMMNILESRSRVIEKA